MPAAYRSLSKLEFEDESIILHLGGRAQALTPQPERGRALVAASMVREGRVLAESDPMYWEPVDELVVKRTFRLAHSDSSVIKVAMRFDVHNRSEDARRPTFQWRLTLPACVPHVYDAQENRVVKCAQGELPRPHRQQNRLTLSFDSERVESINNRILSLNFGEDTPHKITLSQDEASRQIITAFFARDLPADSSWSFTIELNYEVLLSHMVSNTVFLVARPDGEGVPWQGALAATMPWIDRLEMCRVPSIFGPGFRRFAPFLWFDNDKPLPDQVLRFLHDMPSLRRIIVFGEVLRHDLENLLTALLDRGSNQSLRLQIFTSNEYYRDQVNVLRGNVQARMIIADEPAQRVNQLEKVVQVEVVPEPNLLPLVLRRFMEEISDGTFAGDVPARDSAAFIIPAEATETKFLAAAAVPMARHLAAPVLLWHPRTEQETLEHLNKQQARRVFLVGRFRERDEMVISASLNKNQIPTDDKEPANRIVRIPYSDPVRAAAALARLFKSHLLLDWLVREVRAEHEKLGVKHKKPLVQLTRGFIDKIRKHRWARRLTPLLEQVCEGGDVGDMLPVYQDTFIGGNEFVESFQEYFVEAADGLLQTPDGLPAELSPVWNDMVVISDFSLDKPMQMDFFPAACFAAYHSAPLLLFPTVSLEEETFLDRQVGLLELQYFRLGDDQRPPEHAPAGVGSTEDGRHATREASPVLVPAGVADQGKDLARLVFPADVLSTLQSLNPLNVALYSADIRVPYEILSDRKGPIFLNYAMGHLSGTDAYETSLITASGMLYANELQRQHSLRFLLCLANLPSHPLQLLDQEGEAIRGVLGESRFDVETLAGDEITKRQVLELLAENFHIFHFSGHGIEQVARPQRSGVVFWDPVRETVDPLNALEVKYHVKLGAHPLVFLNGCYGGSSARLQLDGGVNRSSQMEEAANSPSESKSMSAEFSEYVMGISSSFLHIGAAAVMAPRWAIYEDTAVLYARYWYEYLAQGCSVGEAALLAKMSCLLDMEPAGDASPKARKDYSVLSYVIWGDPTVRLYPLWHLAENHPETVRKLLRLKR
jgi:hypothetical protein